MACGDAIEVDGARAAPLGMPAATFLKRYWQRKPLLIRQAFPGFESPISGDDLAGVACEPHALARLVRYARSRDRWQVTQGPFDEARFASLPKRDWTLLVQDCDKWFGQIGALLDHFRFVPAWRLDDVMVSFAAPGGSVGAHIDRYDVFLLQGEGRRRWRISVDRDAPQTFRDDAPLKLLRSFTPTHEWVLAPGDMLYLPPGIAHEGVALDRCQTLSIGMRAPSFGELALDYAEFLAEREDDGDARRIRDGTAAPPRYRAELDIAEAARIQRGFAAASRASAAEFARFLTAALARYRASGSGVVATRPLSADAFDKRLDRGLKLVRNPWSRFVWSQAPRGATLAFNGDVFEGSRALARALDRDAPLAAREIRVFDAPDRALLRVLLAAGHLVTA